MNQKVYLSTATGRRNQFLSFYKKSKFSIPYPSASHLKKAAEYFTGLTRPSEEKPSCSQNNRFISRNFSHISKMLSSVPDEGEKYKCEHVKMSFEGSLGIIELARPAKLNSLSLEMVQAITHYIKLLRSRDTCHAILIRAQPDSLNPGKVPKNPAFCAGGDIVEVMSVFEREGIEQAMKFFQLEYNLNFLISIDNPLIAPVISVIDGLTLGGGAGISVNAPYCISTERSIFAMPETAIGFFPDVGATWFLPRLDSGLGVYLGLTGERLHGQQIYNCRLATHYVPSHRINDMVTRLSNILHSKSNLNLIIEEFSGSFQPEDAFQIQKSTSGLPPRIFLEHVFQNSGSIQEILLKLKKITAPPFVPYANQILSTLEQMCPNSLCKTVKLLQAGSKLPSLKSCLKMELAASRYFLTTKTFSHGVTQRIINKDRKSQIVWPVVKDSDEISEFLAPYANKDGEIGSDCENFSASPTSPIGRALPGEKEIRELLLKYNNSHDQVKRHVVSTYSPLKMGLISHIDLLLEHIASRSTL